MKKIIAIFMLLAVAAVFVPVFTSLQKSLPKVAQEVIGGVVHIECPQGQGSGFVVSPHIIVTARHVVNKTEEFKLTFSCGGEVKATRAISSNKYDVGFIWVDSSLPVPLKMGSIENLFLGDSVFAIGGSLGKLHFPFLTAGIVSNLNLDLEAFGAEKNTGWSTLWGSDTSTWRGNSGCPVFNMKGEVVGILVGGPDESMSYCIPIDVFIKDLDQIELMFIEDKYEHEVKEEMIDYNSYYNTEIN